MGNHRDWKKGIGVVLQMVSKIKNGRMLNVKNCLTTAKEFKRKGSRNTPLFNP